MEKLLIEELLNEHENYKKKWLQLSDDDLFNWIGLQDLMITKASNLKSEYLEKKLQIDKDKAMRVLELKTEKDDDWKKVTEKWIEAIIKKEFFERDLDISTSKTICELLIQKAGVITEFVNIVKMNKKANFSM